MRSRIRRGYLVAIEGIDASGKNTQSKLLSKWLTTKGITTKTLSFPDYGTPIGREIKSFLAGRRKYPTELQHLLFAANRWEKCDELESHLRAGALVIVNRYSESNLAYGLANGLDLDWLVGLERGLPTSDLVILLDATPDSVGSRRPGTKKDEFERSSDLQNKAQKAYRELARKRGWKVVDGTKPVGAVREFVRSIVKESLARERQVSL